MADQPCPAAPSPTDQQSKSPSTEVNRLLYVHAIRVNAHLRRSKSWSVSLEAQQAQSLRAAFEQADLGASDDVSHSQQTTLNSDVPTLGLDVDSAQGIIPTSASSSPLPVQRPMHAGRTHDAPMGSPLSAEGARRRSSMLTRRACSQGILDTPWNDADAEPAERERLGLDVMLELSSGVGEVMYNLPMRAPSVKGPNSVVPLGLILDPELRAVWTARDELEDADHEQDDDDEEEEVSEVESEESSSEESSSDEDDDDSAALDGGASSSAGEPVTDAESDTNGSNGAVAGDPNANAVNGESRPIRSSGTEAEAAVLLSPTAAIVSDTVGHKVSLLSKCVASSSVTRGRVSASRVRGSYLDRLGFDRTGGKKRMHHKRKKKAHMGPNARRAALASARARRKPAVRMPLTEPKKAGLKRTWMNKLTKWIVGDEAPPSSLNQSAIDDIALAAAAAAASGSPSSTAGGVNAARKGVKFEKETYVYFIPMRKEIAPEIRRHLWPTRHEFAKMVMRNMDAVEREMHEKASGRHRRSPVATAPERLSTIVSDPVSTGLDAERNSSSSNANKPGGEDQTDSQPANASQLPPSAPPSSGTTASASDTSSLGISLNSAALPMKTTTPTDVASQPGDDSARAKRATNNVMPPPAASTIQPNSLESNVSEASSCWSSTDAEAPLTPHQPLTGTGSPEKVAIPSALSPAAVSRKQDAHEQI